MAHIPRTSLFACRNVLRQRPTIIPTPSFRFKLFVSHSTRNYSTSTPASSTSPRHFLTIADLTSAELKALIKSASRHKYAIKNSTTSSTSLKTPLSGKTISIIFSKRSTRTRISTEGAVVHLGGHPMFLSPQDIQLGVNESLIDTARVVSSMCAGIVTRVGAHADILNLSENSSVPVINALSDMFHPMQAIADMLTISEHWPLEKFLELKLAWVGDANNVLYDLTIACIKLGIKVSVATPKNYEWNPIVRKLITGINQDEGNGKIEMWNNPLTAVKDADIIVTDTWVSMGQEEEKAKRLKEFKGFQITEELAKKGRANEGWKFMHCLPRKPEEVSDEVFYGPRSIVFQEAENRLYSAIASLEAFIVNKGKITED